MNKKTTAWIIIAASLILIGILIFVGAMTMLKWDFTKLSTVKLETNEYCIGEEYKNISIEDSTADIEFKISDSFSVVCHEEEGANHSVTVKNNTLFIKESPESKKWYEHIGISFRNNKKIMVYIPSGDYGTLSIKISTGDALIPDELNFESIDISASTGDINAFSSAKGSVDISTGTGNITVGSISCDSLSLTVSTGKITVSDVAVNGNVKINVSTGKSYVTDIKCKDLTSVGNTGDISLTNVICKNKLSVERSTGDVKLDKSDAGEIYIETDTGDVTGTLLNEKIFITKWN